MALMCHLTDLGLTVDGFDYTYIDDFVPEFERYFPFLKSP